MCIGIPVRIITIKGRRAVVDCWGTRTDVRLSVLEEPVFPGDYVIDHAGFALRRIPAEQVADTLAMYETVLAEPAEDLIVREIFWELESAYEVC